MQTRGWNTSRVAVVDDDPIQLRMSVEPLQDLGLSVIEFCTGRKFISAFHHDTFDLLILDWIMPDLSGLDVLNHIRRSGARIPVMMVTCRTEGECIVEGLRAGADDYVTKPIRSDVFQARVQALMRRIQEPGDQANTQFSLFGYDFNPALATVRFSGGTVTLTSREFELARMFFKNPHRSLSRQYLLERLWGKAADQQSRTLDTHVARLRAKLDLAGVTGVRLKSLYAFGYRLEPPIDPDTDAS